MKVRLITGPIQTGKTTHLLKWCTGRSDVDGILAPIINGHRHLVRISTGDTRDLEVLGRGDTPVKVGPYTFSSQVFQWGREQLADVQSQLPSLSQTKWLVVDEYGKLELRGEGLEPAVSEIFATLRSRKGTPTVAASVTMEIDVILVIRQGLVEPALRRLGIDGGDVDEFEFRQQPTVVPAHEPPARGSDR